MLHATAATLQKESEEESIYIINRLNGSVCASGSYMIVFGS